MNSRPLSTLSVAAIAALVAVAPALADDNPRSRVYGKTISEWSAKWWQWAYAGADGKNAVQDTTGAYCANHQPADTVWFLAGTFGGTGVERTCTIPAGRALFYSPLNSLWTDCPGTSDETLSDAEVREILTIYGTGGDTACKITSALDGVSISSLRVPTIRTQSPKFATILPTNHLVGGCDAPLPPGKTGRQISEGYWIMLPPLSPGEHTLTLDGASCDPGTGGPVFESGVTYHLTVLAGPEED